MSREGVTQGDPLLIVLYGITLVPLGEELRAADLGLLLPFYANDAAFDGSAGQSVQLLKLLMKRGPYWVYFPKPAKSLFISDTPGQEAAAVISSPPNSKGRDFSLMASLIVPMT